MDEARAVLDRLDRIEQLDRAGAEPAELLPELRALIDEAAAWTRAERATERGWSSGCDPHCTVT